MMITAGTPVTGDQLIGREKEIRLINMNLSWVSDSRIPMNGNCWQTELQRQQKSVYLFAGSYE